MKKFRLSLLLTVLMSMVGTTASAQDIEVANDDGVTIYYNFTNSGLSVTHKQNFTYPSTRLVIPSSVTYNGTTYPVTSIGDFAFSTGSITSGLTSVTIPNSITSIGKHAFASQSKLISLTIPSSVTNIGEGAFAGCHSLKYLNIPNSVISIGKDAFNGTVWYDNQSDGVVYAGKVAYKYKGSMPSNTSITLQQGTLGIAGGLFENCSNLKSVIIPNSVTSIGDEAFYGCI